MVLKSSEEGYFLGYFSNHNDCRGLVILVYAPKNSYWVVYRVDRTKKNKTFIEELIEGYIKIFSKQMSMWPLYFKINTEISIVRMINSE